MSDPKSDFLAAVGRMAEASDTPTAECPHCAAGLDPSLDHPHTRLERLQRDNAAMESAKNAAMTLAHEREAEIKRLEAERDTARSLISDWKTTVQSRDQYQAAASEFRTRAETAEAEVARLREALREAKEYASYAPDDNYAALYSRLDCVDTIADRALAPLEPK